VLALVVALLSVPASAAEFTPWPDHEVVAPSLLFQRVKNSDDELAPWLHWRLTKYPEPSGSDSG
jgi:hypothetical protein